MSRRGLRIESPEYRSALRAVSQISGADGGVSKPKLTIEELESVITPEVSSLFSGVPHEGKGGEPQQEKGKRWADIRTESPGESFPNSSNSDFQPN